MEGHEESLPARKVCSPFLIWRKQEVSADRPLDQDQLLATESVETGLGSGQETTISGLPGTRSRSAESFNWLACATAFHAYRHHRPATAEIRSSALNVNYVINTFDRRSQLTSFKWNTTSGNYIRPMLKSIILINCHFKLLPFSGRLLAFSSRHRHR